MLEEFAFLEERGGQLIEVSFHQNGDGIGYSGAWGTVWLEFEPDSNWIGGKARLTGDSGTFDGDLDALVREQLPATPLPSVATLDRETIAAHVTLWAAALRAATDPR